MLRVWVKSRHTCALEKPVKPCVAWLVQQPATEPCKLPPAGPPPGMTLSMTLSLGSHSYV